MDACVSKSPVEEINGVYAHYWQTCTKSEFRDRFALRYGGLLKVGSKPNQPSSWISTAPAIENSTNLWALGSEKVLSCEIYCSELDYAYVCLQRVFHAARGTRSCVKIGKHDLTIWVLKNWEKRLVYILRKLNLVFIKMVMHLWKQGIDIRFRMLLNHKGYMNSRRQSKMLLFQCINLFEDAAIRGVMFEGIWNI